MNVGMTEQQARFRERVREFARASCLDRDIVQSDRDSRFNRKAWDACGRFGLLGGPVPKEFGGAGLDLVTYVSGLEALGEASRDNGLMFAMGAHVFACELSILDYGSAAQRQRWLPDLCSGAKIAAIAVAEQHGASDAFDMRTTAEARGEGYLLNGRKSYVTNAPFCDVALVFARLLGKEDTIVCLLVERENPGMVRSAAVEKMGVRTAPFGEIEFRDCWVPGDACVGKPSSGKLVFMSAMEWERGCLLAPFVGGMQRQLDLCIEHARSMAGRSRPLSTHQAIAHRLADMKVRLEVARLVLYNFACKKQTARHAHLEASIAKLVISESIVQNALDAVQIYGARGYTCELGMERELRDAIGTRIASGTSDIQRNIIAKYLHL